MLLKSPANNRCKEYIYLQHVAVWYSTCPFELQTQQHSNMVDKGRMSMLCWVSPSWKQRWEQSEYSRFQCVYSVQTAVVQACLPLLSHWTALHAMAQDRQ